MFASEVYSRSKMSVFEANSRHLREVFILITYGETALSERTCREWFQCFKSGDFNVEDRNGGGREKIFEDSKLEALLAEDSYQMQKELVE